MQGNSVESNEAYPYIPNILRMLGEDSYIMGYSKSHIPVEVDRSY